MIRLLEYTFMQNALIAGIIISILCALIGVYLVLKKLSLLGDGLAHGAFAGVAFGILLGIYPFFSALLFTSISALSIRRLIQKAKIYGDSAIAVLLAFSIAIAVIIIGIVKGFNKDLFSYLFGSILTVTTTDILLMLLIAALVIIFLIKNYDALLISTFNSQLAQVSKIKVNQLENALVLLAALTIVVASKVAGTMLVSALIVIPAITAIQIAKSFKQTLFLAIIVSIFAVISGIITSFYFDLPPGGTIVLILCGLFAISLLSRK